MSSSTRRSGRKPQATATPIAVKTPAPVVAPKSSTGSHAALVVDPPIDFTKPRFPEVYLARRESAPGLKRIIATPEEIEPFAFEMHSEQRAFWFIDHPCIANIIPYLRRHEHVEAQKPGIISVLLDSCFDVLVSDF